MFSCVQAGREEWMRLRHELMPLLKQGPIIFLAQARQLLPRQLLSQPAATEYQATENVSVCVGRGPEAADDAVDAASDSGEENSAEVIQLAKEKVKETREADGEEVDFDDLDILDELEEAAAAIRKERREQRRRRRAAREAWIREAKIEAKRKEALDVSGASVKPASIHERPPWLWKQLATDAFKSGNYYQAQFYYTREAESYGLEPFTASIIHDKVNGKQEISDCNGQNIESQPSQLATALSNRSHCFARLGHFEASLADARRAAEIRPDWARAWSRVGAAAAAGSAEACDAWRRAVQIDPCSNHLEGLEEACRRAQKGAGKEQGNEALRARDWHGAIACFTEALAVIPARSQSTQDGYSLLRCILFSNRSSMEIACQSMHLFKDSDHSDT